MVGKVHLSHTPRFSTALELPVRMMKQILVSRNVPFGGRVLVAGCGHGELVAFLDGIAYQVDAVTDSPEEIEQLRKRCPQYDFHYARLDEAVGAPPDVFDLILVQDLCVYRNNLLDLGTRSATANLLACLKPGGDLVFVRKQDGPMGCGTGHEAGCWKRHLACFPGQITINQYPESFFGRSTWDWFCGNRDHGDYFTVTMQSPPEKLNRNFWRDFARRGLMTGQGKCCAGQAAGVPALRAA
ncbi:class I SAM-dependent methyltransferase [Schlesneria sp. T3-172]|uniref:class I SAM-dependent methyltransferase n=1 Tax=Schlesneria sphaerica TaxID=3373610 RepID=UPI0037C7494E